MGEPVLLLSEITPEWLGDILRTNGFDPKIASFTAVPIGTGQVGATYRLSIEYSHNEGNAPPSLVVKLPSNNPISRATGKSHLTYIRESRFYQQFAGKKPLPVPDHLYIAFDDSSHDFTLLMHDLPNHHAGNQLVVPSVDEATVAVGAAAEIHAAWWGNPMLDCLDWPNGTRAVPPALDLEAIYAMLWPAFCDRYGDQVSTNMKRVGEAFVGKIGEWSNNRPSPRCLVHGDFRPDNMLFNPTDSAKPVVIVDWQTVGVGCGASDIAYFTGTALDPMMRRAEEKRLFAHYQTSLIQCGVPDADTVDLWQAYIGSAFSGFLMGCTASMVVEQTARGDAMFLAMCERSAAMVLDHGAAALPA
jgi:hypothetical protein